MAAKQPLSRFGGRLYGRRIWWTAFVIGMAAVIIIGLQKARHSEYPAAETPLKQDIEPANPSAKTNDPPNKPSAGQSESQSGEPGGGPAGQAGDPFERVPVRVWLTDERRLETVPLEIYVRGVVAGEMPASFEEEALKAQAIAARTYIVKRLRDGGTMKFGAVEADVDNTENTQVYIPFKRMQEKMPKDDLAKWNKAMMETRGQIITYAGEPIQAVFFSTSNGYTENSEDYWNLKLPYLRSVPSPWDETLSPRYMETVTMKLKDFYNRLGIPSSDRKTIMVTSRTEGNRIKELTIGKLSLSGREARERLSLRSSEFTWVIHGSTITITTYGSGHGVGMSQWGADGMAKAGRTAKQILEYYYTGAKVEQASKLPNRI